MTTLTVTLVSINGRPMPPLVITVEVKGLPTPTHRY